MSEEIIDLNHCWYLLCTEKYLDRDYNDFLNYEKYFRLWEDVNESPLKFKVIKFTGTISNLYCEIVTLTDQPSYVLCKTGDQFVINKGSLIHVTAPCDIDDEGDGSSSHEAELLFKNSLQAYSNLTDITKEVILCNINISKRNMRELETHLKLFKQYNFKNYTVKILMSTFTKCGIEFNVTYIEFHGVKIDERGNVVDPQLKLISRYFPFHACDTKLNTGVEITNTLRYMFNTNPDHLMFNQISPGFPRTTFLIGDNKYVPSLTIDEYNPDQYDVQRGYIIDPNQQDFSILRNISKEFNKRTILIGKRYDGVR